MSDWCTVALNVVAVSDCSVLCVSYTYCMYMCACVHVCSYTQNRYIAYSLLQNEPTPDLLHIYTHTYVHTRTWFMHWVFTLTTLFEALETCGAHVCYYGGTCVNDTCQCPNNTFGVYCEYVKGEYTSALESAVICDSTHVPKILYSLLLCKCVCDNLCIYTPPTH